MELQTVTTHRIRGPLLILLVAGVAVVAAAVGAVAADRFSDVPDGHAFDDQIGWMAASGISGGYADGTFRPDAPVTRQAMAAFMQRLAGQDPDVEPTVDAATVGGLTPAELMPDTSSLEARLTALEDRVDDLESENTTLRTTVTTLEDQLAERGDEVAALQTLLADVSREDDALGRDTLTFTGMNLQVVNGAGTTDGDPNGLGNLIVGYDAQRPSGSDRSGSHYLVVGDQHEYSSFGGILAGFHNTASGEWASVTGGSYGTAAGKYASVSGGLSGTATGYAASTTGGADATASGGYSTVAGGYENTASGGFSAVLGGTENVADGNRASIAAGQRNEVTGMNASVLGGYRNTAAGLRSSILGGSYEDVTDDDSCHPGC